MIIDYGLDVFVLFLCYKYLFDRNILSSQAKILSIIQDYKTR